MKYCLNIEELFSELDFYDKFKAAKEAGYDYVEFWGWKDRDLNKIKRVCDDNKVTVTAIKGEQSWSLCDSDSTDNFVSWIKQSVEAAKMLGCNNIIVHSNHIGPDGAADFSDRFSAERHIANIATNLMRIAPILENANVNMLLEPLSTLGKLKATFLTNAQVAADIIRAVNSPNIKMVYDIFQMQVACGNPTAFICQNLDIIDYVHIADSPNRSEPGTGEINFTYLLNAIKEKGFSGVACIELTPTGDTEFVVRKIDEMIQSIK